MSLIGDIGRKTLKNRLIMAGIYLTLSLMGLTMLVPFLITVSGSASNDFDYERYSPIPRYLWSEKDRFVKALVPYFNQTRNWQKQFAVYAPGIQSHWTSWTAIGRDCDGVDRFAEKYLNKANSVAAADYAEFTEEYPVSDCVVYGRNMDTVTFLIGEYSEKYKKLNPDANCTGAALQLKALELLGKEWHIPFRSFYNISFNEEMLYPMDFQGWFPKRTQPKHMAYERFKEAVAAHRFTPGVKRAWMAFLGQKNYAGEKLFPVLKDAPKELWELWLEFKKQHAPATPAVPYAMRAVWYAYLESEETALKNNGKKFTVADYNRLCGTNYRSFSETPFPVPESFPVEMQKFWKTFLQENYPLRLVRITPSPELDRQLQQFAEKTIRSLKTLNGLLGTDFTSWSELHLSAEPPAGDSTVIANQRELWKNFVKTIPAGNKEFLSSEQAYQKFLLKKYGSIEEINRKYNWNLRHIEEAFPPFMDAYAVTFAEIGNSMAFFPVIENYAMVAEYMFFNGNAVWVTLLLVAMTIFFTLTVNPLAAYALSRFNLRCRQQILVFMLATMAFPAMVSAIPAYLLMKDLGMLNTFWALVIPGAANGMSIFILKGFFDSLPMELFEAATIDGASEFEIFWIIAMPLVKPILAINCLNAFIAAYNGWEWALIICQDKSMWTIAVWLYQASITWSNTPWLISAGFVLASIPTLLVFIACQKVILRGIVIPSMK